MEPKAKGEEFLKYRTTSLKTDDVTWKVKEKMPPMKILEVPSRNEYKLKFPDYDDIAFSASIFSKSLVKAKS